jgi:predicted 2-oxoglutarate/Fe(II)-dependent dioxygenase YbiX
MHRATGTLKRRTQVRRFLYARRILLLLDIAVRRLSTGGADADAVRQLAIVYHNLLRQWVGT